MAASCDEEDEYTIGPVAAETHSAVVGPTFFPGVSCRMKIVCYVDCSIDKPLSIIAL